MREQSEEGLSFRKIMEKKQGDETESGSGESDKEVETVLGPTEKRVQVGQKQPQIPQQPVGTIALEFGQSVQPGGWFVADQRRWQEQVGQWQPMFQIPPVFQYSSGPFVGGQPSYQQITPQYLQPQMGQG